MQILVLGLVLWTASHMFKGLAPGLRAKMGEIPSKMAVTILSLAGLMLMIIGYLRAEFMPVYYPLEMMGYVNNALMIPAVFLFGLPFVPGVLRTRIRHPMLIGTFFWAVAHLIVNGDIASVVLFGGLGIWSLAEIALINRRGGWTPPKPRTFEYDLVYIAVAVGIYAAIGRIHAALGHNPLLGIYG